jgi:Thiolase, N-terminal domain
MSRAAIVAPVRTAVGRFGGTLRPVPAEDLAATVIRAVVARSGIDPERIEDVVMAQSYANSEAPCIGRWAALQAGLPIAVPGLQIDRRCGGGLQAVATAAMMVQTGAADAVLAGGTRLVYGGHTIGIALSQAARALPGLVTVAGWHSCDHLAPVREGDPLRSSIEVESAQSLPAGGLAQLRSWVFSGVGHQVLDSRPSWPEPVPGA